MAPIGVGSREVKGLAERRLSCASSTGSTWSSSLGALVRNLELPLHDLTLSLVARWLRVVLCWDLASVAGAAA